jgi:PhnB protein
MSGAATTGSRLRPVPGGCTTVTPWLVSCDTAGVLDFLHRAFGAEEFFRVQADDGGIGHAETRIGDAIVLPFDARPSWPDTPCFLRFGLPDGTRPSDGSSTPVPPRSPR